MEIDRVRNCPSSSSSSSSVHQTTPRDCIHVTIIFEKDFYEAARILKTSITDIIDCYSTRYYPYGEHSIRARRRRKVDKEYGREIEEGTRCIDTGGDGEGERWLVIDAQHQLVKPPCVELL